MPASEPRTSRKRASGKRTSRKRTSRRVPPKYLGGLSGRARSKRRAEIEARASEAADYGAHRPLKSYRPFATDVGVETKPSSYTRRFAAKYGQLGGDLREIAKATRQDVAPKASTRAYLRALETVYARGMAAWATGHRPGASQHAWGLARIYSFVLNGKTRHTADADVARRLGAA